MGMDLLDFTFRIEKSFGLNIGQVDIDRLIRDLPDRSPLDATVGELHNWVKQLCMERGIRLPPSSWHRVQLEMAKVVGKSPRLVHRATFIKREHGFC
jgi:hypothetical protein